MKDNLNIFIEGLKESHSRGPRNIRNFLSFKDINFKESKYNFFFNYNNYNFIIIIEFGDYFNEELLYQAIIPRKKNKCLEDIIYWEEPLNKATLYNPKILYELFKFLKIFDDVFFEKLTLENLYFSKKYNQFLFKTFPEYIEIEDSFYESGLTFIPRNILKNKDLFSYQNKNISYRDFIKLNDRIRRNFRDNHR